MRDMTPVIDTMKALIEYHDMSEHCLCKTDGCGNCPYQKKGVCDKVSTEQMLKMCAEVFREFLEEE